MCLEHHLNLLGITDPGHVQGRRLGVENIHNDRHKAVAMRLRPLCSAFKDASSLQTKSMSWRYLGRTKGRGIYATFAQKNASHA
jgi:hypothetical protein